MGRESSCILAEHLHQFKSGVPAPMPKPLAAIDIGSNTIHLLVGEVKDAAVIPITSERIQARLGAGVDGTGRIENRRLRIATEAVALFAEIAASSGAPQPAIVATSAVRDAENGQDLVGAIRILTQLDVRLLSGEKEALLGFRGAMSSVKVGAGSPVVVFDLGGGSAQLSLGTPKGGPEMDISLPLGSNRTTERFLSSDPPKAKELQKLRQAVIDALPGWKLPKGAAIVAVGGSARALGRLTTDQLTVERLDALAAELSRDPSRVVARDFGIPPIRARVLPAAATTLAALLAKYSQPSLAVAQTGLREGVLLTLAEGGKL